MQDLLSGIGKLLPGCFQHLPLIGQQLRQIFQRVFRADNVAHLVYAQPHPDRALTAQSKLEFLLPCVIAQRQRKAPKAADFAAFRVFQLLAQFQQLNARVPAFLIHKALQGHAWEGRIFLGISQCGEVTFVSRNFLLRGADSFW